MDGPRHYHVTLSKPEKYHDYHLYVGSKKDTNEFIYKTETDLQILKTNLWLPKMKVCVVGNKLGVWDEHTHTTVYDR